ncbi:MAG: RsmG family class I SAM-dependent methyltransferase [Acidimicrobiales bacterium]
MTTPWLPRALELSRARGYLGPGPISGQISHAEGFMGCWEEFSTSPPRRVLDLGSGGGLPGLVLLDHWGSPTVLLDSMIRRSDFLREVLAWPDAPAGGSVVTARAEAVARRTDLQETFDLVTARSFGLPATTSECAAQFLETGGVLIVSERPEESVANRWNPDGLARLGLRSVGRRRHGAAFQVVVKDAATPAEYPRAVGIPGKRPLF